MSQITWCEVSRLRRSLYNPRIVQDPEKTRILKTSIKREGVKQPLIVYEAGDGFFEVLDVDGGWPQPPSWASRNYPAWSSQP